MKLNRIFQPQKKKTEIQTYEMKVINDAKLYYLILLVYKKILIKTKKHMNAYEVRDELYKQKLTNQLFLFKGTIDLGTIDLGTIDLSPMEE